MTLSHRVARARLGAALILSACAFSAQGSEENWTEKRVAPPASFSQERLLSLDAASGSALRYGLDPASLSLGADGVVRYVLVARSSSGALNVLFEGIRCATAEMKTFARWNNAGEWNLSPDAPWRPLLSSGSTRQGLLLARQGLCDGKTPNGNAANILRSLKAN
jgi:hypothetical protein